MTASRVHRGTHACRCGATTSDADAIVVSVPRAADRVSRSTGYRGRAPRQSAGVGNLTGAYPRRMPDLVWSSDGGDLRRARDEPAPRPRGGGPVKVRRETAGRRGKAVTTISGVPLGDDGLRELAGRLKKRCGVGGSAKDGVIELQGDHRDVVVELLREGGYDVVLAGG
jgi:translation initiation factor 1